MKYSTHYAARLPCYHQIPTGHPGIGKIAMNIKLTSPTATPGDTCPGRAVWRKDMKATWNCGDGQCQRQPQSEHVAGRHDIRF